MSWNQLKESGFDREPYRNCERFECWDALVDAVAYSHGSRMTIRGKGNRAGIHLFVQATDSGERFWLYILLLRMSPPHDAAKELKAGDRIRVETVHTEVNHAWVKSLEKLALPK